MALSGLQVYKLLPKTNCKDCGFPTCMAFAMQLAAGKVDLDRCPHVAEDIIAELSEAAAPPVRRLTLGAGGRAVTVGEETVMYRHERRFEHAPLLALRLGDALSDDEFSSALDAFRALAFDRVGQTLQPGGLAIASADAVRLASRAALAQERTQAPLVLMSSDAAALRAAAAPLAAARPLLYAADSGNLEDMVAVALELDLPLVLQGGDWEAAGQLAERAMGLGLKDIVLETLPRNLQEALRDQTLIRRAAVKKKSKPLGFPTLALPGILVASAGAASPGSSAAAMGSGVDAARQGRWSASGPDPLLATVFAAFFVAKYASIIVVDTIDPAQLLPLLVLSQNLYTDPQRPMQVEEGIYPLNDPGPESPVLLTTNFSLTYFTVAGEVENGRLPAWLLVMNVEGQSVLTAWAAGKFVPEAIAPFVKKSGVAEKVRHRRLLIPGYVAQISGELEEELGGEWQVVVGPREAADIPRFLRGPEK